MANHLVEIWIDGRLIVPFHIADTTKLEPVDGIRYNGVIVTIVSIEAERPNDAGNDGNIRGMVDDLRT